MKLKKHERGDILIRVNLKQILKDKNMTLTELHEKTGISITTLSTLANEKSNGIQFNTLSRILDVTGANLSDVLLNTNELFDLSIINKSKRKIFKMNCEYEVQYTVLFTNSYGEEHKAEFFFSLMYYPLGIKKVIHVTLNGCIPQISSDKFYYYIYEGKQTLLDCISYLMLFDLFVNLQLEKCPEGTLVIFDWSNYSILSKKKYPLINDYLVDNREFSFPMLDLSKLYENPIVEKILVNEDQKIFNLKIYMN